MIHTNLYSFIHFGYLFLTMGYGYILSKQYTDNIKLAASQKNELAHSEKLATIGTITASIGHEINNPNNALLLSLQSQKQVWEELVPVLDSYAKEHGDFEIGGYQYSEIREEMPGSFLRAIENSDRIKNIVADLRAFSRKDEGTFDETVLLNDVVHNSLRLVGNLIKKKTNSLKLELQEPLPAIKGNTQKLEQVVINLLQNAAQALENSEKSITVTTSYNEVEKMALLTVADEGKGIDKKDLEHIFDPFFTTKGKSEGTGLGLSICKRIIKQHGGTIAVESEVGVGTEVKVSFPDSGER